MINKVHGDEVQPRMIINPYNTSPAQEPDYAHGFNYAKNLGHMQLNTLTPEQIHHWKHSSTAWKDGFKKSLEQLGEGRIADMLKTSVVAEAIVDPLINRHAINKYVGENDVSARHEAELRKPDTTNFVSRVGASALPAYGGALAGFALGAYLGAGELLDAHTGLSGAIGSVTGWTPSHDAMNWIGGLPTAAAAGLAVATPIHYSMAKNQARLKHEQLLEGEKPVSSLFGGLGVPS